MVLAAGLLGFSY